MREELLLFEDGGDGRQVGTVSCTRQGMYVRFGVSCPRQAGQPGVQKAWLEQGERRLLLGTLAPEGDRLTLRRSVSLTALAEQGLTDPERAVVTGASGRAASPNRGADPRRSQPAEPQGYPNRQPTPNRQTAPQWQGLHSLPVPQPEGTDPTGRGGWTEDRDGYLLRFPWGGGQPFPLLPLFCFARVGEGAVYYRLDGRGLPRMPG